MINYKQALKQSSITEDELIEFSARAKRNISLFNENSVKLEDLKQGTRAYNKGYYDKETKQYTEKGIEVMDKLKGNIAHFNELIIDDIALLVDKKEEELQKKSPEQEQETVEVIESIEQQPVVVQDLPDSNKRSRGFLGLF